MAVVNEKKFYILRAVTGKEAKVKDDLDREIRLTDLGRYVSQVFVPTEKVVSQRNGKKIVKERPSLPGYIIVEAALVGDVAYRLRSTPNVIGFLGGSRGSDPEPMNPLEVERLMKRADEIAESEGEYEIDFYVGDIVKVTDDAF
ncbi:MAG: transcription termination/antitermination NusG family protein, partial [Porphyromonas sp.]|nr:transcription termination/antitermination NusG family protein [Porphyromonas sp.]